MHPKCREISLCEVILFILWLLFIATEEIMCTHSYIPVVVSGRSRVDLVVVRVMFGIHKWVISLCFWALSEMFRYF